MTTHPNRVQVVFVAAVAYVAAGGRADVLDRECVTGLELRRRVEEQQSA